MSGQGIDWNAQRGHHDRCRRHCLDGHGSPRHMTSLAGNVSDPEMTVDLNLRSGQSDLHTQTGHVAGNEVVVVAVVGVAVGKGVGSEVDGVLHYYCCGPLDGKKTPLKESPVDESEKRRRHRDHRL